MEGLCVLRMWRVPSREPRQRSWPVRSQQTEKILPRVLEVSVEALSAASCSSSSFALPSLDSTQRFCSLLNVQMRTTHHIQHIPQFQHISTYFKSNSYSNSPIFLHNQHHFLSFPFPTLFMTRSNGKCLTIRRPFSTQRSSLDLQHDQSWNPSSVFKCPHVGIAVLRAGENAVVVRVPIQRSHGQVVLILTHQTSFLLRSTCATASNPRTEANCNFRRWGRPSNSSKPPRFLHCYRIQLISNEFYHRSSNDKTTSWILCRQSFVAYLDRSTRRSPTHTL